MHAEADPRMLLAAQGLSRDKEFQGQLQLAVTILRDGKTAILSIPASGQDPQKFAVAFKRFKRIEGVFQVPPESVAKQVEVRLLQGGLVVATQQVSL